MGSKKKLNYGEDLNSEYKSSGVRGEKKTKKRSSRHNAKVMIDKVNHGLLDSTELDEYLEFDSIDD